MRIGIAMKKTQDHDSKLYRTRRAIAARVRSLRRARGWTQAELAAKLGLSQSRLSELEAGDGSFAAEHLLTVLALFNVDLAAFGVEADDDGELQNALVRHGAKHLRELSGVVPTGRYTRPADAVRTVLLEPRSERWLAALAPVVVWSIDELALPPLQHALAVAGLPDRLGWLVENVVAATGSTTAPAGPWRQRSRRAEVVLAAFLAHVEPPASPAPDPLDRAIRSPKTWQEVWSAASPISRRWGVVTALQPDDFARALEAAHASD